MSIEKNPMSSSRIEPATFQLVAYCLNELPHHMPRLSLRFSLSRFRALGTRPSPYPHFLHSWLSPGNVLEATSWRYGVEIFWQILLHRRAFLRNKTKGHTLASVLLCEIYSRVSAPYIMHVVQKKNLEIKKQELGLKLHG
jgi:hypothetical protein